MTIKFQPASRQTVKLRMALVGPSGSGKTYTALAVASGLGGRIAVIDTEHGSSALYADRFRFDVCTLEDDFSPARYLEAIQAAQGYNVLIIDSLSHAWVGPGGVLELVDRVAKRTPTTNTFAGWREITPLHRKLIETILNHSGHVIVTLRTKTEYVVKQDDISRRTTVQKVGLAPIQREGLEYEFDIVGDMTLENELIVSKTRFPSLAGQILSRPGQELGEMLLALLVGESTVPPPPPPPPTPSPQQGWEVWTTEQKRRLIGELSGLGLSTEQMRAAFGVQSRTQIDLPAKEAFELVAILREGKLLGMAPEEIYQILGVASLREWYPRPATEAIARITEYKR